MEYHFLYFMLRGFIPASPPKVGGKSFIYIFIYLLLFSRGSGPVEQKNIKNVWPYPTL